MDFGEVDDPSAIDHALPPDRPITAATLARLSARGRPTARVRYGMPIWNRPSWVGPLYPLDTPQGNYLPTYGRLFETVEVNSTFYHPPASELIESWAQSVPPSFRFCVKVWRNLSHDPAPRPADLERFLECARAFGDRLGLCFLQLPPQANLEWRRSLARLLDGLAPHVPLAIELRHVDWFRREPTHTRLLAHLAERGVGLVITDTSGRRDLVHMAVTAPFAMVRFRGDDAPALDEARVDAWIERIESWLDGGLEQLYFIAHEPNDHEIAALPLLARLGERLGARPQLEIMAPPRAPQLSLL